MSIYWNEKTRLLQPYVPGEQPRDRKFIKLNTNENPYPPSPKAIEAMRNAACESLRLYPDPSCTELRETAATRYGIKRDEVFAGNGSDEILAFAFAAFFGSRGKQSASLNGNYLLFPDITYSFYPVYANLWDIPYKTVPLNPDFSMDLRPYLDMLNRNECGGIIIANPNAPTGIALPLNSVRELAAAAEAKKQVLVIDEAYIAFADAPDVGVAIPLMGEFPNILIVRTFSKEASLAGLRVGFAFGSSELIEGLGRIRDCFNSYTMDRVALAGAAAALEDAAYYTEINSVVIATREKVSAGLASLGFTVLPSQANFVFASPPESGNISGQSFFLALRERGFLVRHFNKPRISGFLRISMGTGAEMDAFIDACSDILKNKE
jgi:histidinol-phosphate aminotransferase